MAGTGAWSSDDTYSAELCGYESPYCLALRLRFAGEEVVVDREWNVALGQNQTKRPQLVGRAEPRRQACDGAPATMAHRMPAAWEDKRAVSVATLVAGKAVRDAFFLSQFPVRTLPRVAIRKIFSGG